MEPVEVDGTQRWKIFPARDERVLRVVRKIVRGLSYFHRLGIVATDPRVWTDVLRWRIPDEILAGVDFRSIDADVFQYWFEAYEEGDATSLWYLKFFERLPFIAAVSRQQNGWEQPAQDRPAPDGRG